MDAKHYWLVSTAIHGVLLVGAAGMTVDHFVRRDGEGTGFTCRLGDPTARFDRVERPKDRFESRIPLVDGSTITEVYASVGTFGEGDGEDQGRWPICCVCGCGGATTALAAWPRD